MRISRTQLSKEMKDLYRSLSSEEGEKTKDTSEANLNFNIQNDTDEYF